jgi:sensor histidine kinase YesM
MANLIGYSIHAIFWLGSRAGLEAWVERRGLGTRMLYFTALPTVGVVAGFQAWLTLFHLEVETAGHKYGLILRSTSEATLFSDPGWIVSVAATSMVISFMLAIFFSWRERAARAQTQAAHERARVERIEREAVVANLRALQAQIEPHFLFNTLANVTTLIDRDPAQAKNMLETFIRFLRASLATTREESATLGAEADLIAAYLAVLKVRMGARLSYLVDIPPELAGYRLAPMLLQPIVENAIRHGLEPKVEGGELRVAARRENGAVEIDIIDTGVGFGATTRSEGVGLSNLRARLQGLYGARATVAITDNAPSGTRVSVRLPA